MYVYKALWAGKAALSVILATMIIRMAGIAVQADAVGPAAASAVSVRPTGSPAPQVTIEPEYDVIVNSKLFGHSVAVVRKASSTAEGADALIYSSAEELGLALFGTIAGSPAISRAVIKDLKTNTVETYKVGQKVLDANIEKIDKDAVTLNNDGDKKVLRLKAVPSGSMAYEDSSEEFEPPVSDDFEEIEEIIDQEPSPIVIQTHVKKIEKILKKAKIRVHKVDGKMQGLELTRLDRVPEALAFGLRDGDVIRSVNGQLLDSKVKAYQVFKKARSMNEIDFELKRGDELHEFSFKFK